MSTESISTNSSARAAHWSNRSSTLPLTRDLTLPYTFSFLIALLVALVAVAGLAFPDRVYAPKETLLAFFPVDLFHLVVGLPVLLISIWLARRGWLVGLLCWPGALLYFLYSYITNLLGVPFGVLFLPYLLLVVLSAYAVIALAVSIDGERVRGRLAGHVPVRTTVAVLVGLTTLFVVVNVSTIVTALVAHPPVAPEHPVFVLIADFTTVIPLCLAGGILLWRQTALGYTAGTGLLLFYSLLLISLVPVLTFPAFSDGSAIAVGDVLLMLGCGLLCLFLLVRFLWASCSTEAQAPLSN